MDYYKILELDSKSATHESIANSFRRLALKNHPLRNKDNLDSSQRAFNQICEAYEVLSNADFKATYDKSGIDALKNGATKKKDGKFLGGYCFSGNSFEIFKRFFGTQNPFNDNFQGVDPATLVNDPNDEKAPKDIHKEVPCSIYEFYNGSLKTLDYNRDRIMPDGRSTESVEEQLVIEVKPGFDTDTVLTFASKGNEAYSYHQSKLVVSFTLQDDEIDSNYRRKGKNLIYTHTMSLEDALLSKPIQIKTLDGRFLNICLDDMITPQTVHVISGEGIPTQDGAKGDLHVKFNITFPQNLKVEYKNAILDILKE